MLPLHESRDCVLEKDKIGMLMSMFDLSSFLPYLPQRPLKKSSVKNPTKQRGQDPQPTDGCLA